MCNTIGNFDVFLIYITSSSLCPTQRVGLFVVKGLTVNFGSCNTHVHNTVTSGPSKTFNISLYVKLYSDLTCLISGGLNSIGIEIVSFGPILP